MNVRRIVTVCATGVLTLFLQAGLAAATEGRTSKPESVPATSLKPDLSALPAKPPSANGDHKAGEKSKLPTTSGVVHQLAVLPVAASELVGKDGAPMVLVSAGEFVMGSEKGDEDEAPVHRVYLNAFYIDKFEVTNGRFAKYVEAIQSEPPWGFTDKETPVIHAERPVRWVNWMDAMGYCLWLGKRLPTEAEWEKAARGTDERTYPWGNDPPTPVHAVYGVKEGGAETVSVIGNHHMGQSPNG